MVGKLSISFGTPIKKNNACFMNAVEGYLHFGNKTAHVIVLDRKTGAIVVKSKPGLFAIAAKIGSMILSLGLFPLIALTIKAISRTLSNNRLEKILYLSSKEDLRKSIKENEQIIADFPISSQADNLIKNNLAQIDMAIAVKLGYANNLWKGRIPNHSESEGLSLDLLRLISEKYEAEIDPSTRVQFKAQLQIKIDKEILKNPSKGIAFLF